MSQHQVIGITSALTKSGTPMWRCTTADGQSFALFMDRFNTPGTVRLFSADYPEVLDLQHGETLRWTQHPILVELIPDGQYLKPVKVAPRPEGAVPDVRFVPDAALAKAAARRWAELTLASCAVIFDTETTGSDPLNDEIVSIAAISTNGTVLLHQTIRPANPQRLVESGAGQVNGFTPEALASAPTFPQVYDQIKAVLDGQPWVIYNADFDTAVLERECLRHGLEPITALATSCAMRQWARFNGEWDAERQSYAAKKLVEAAAACGIDAAGAHDALADAQMTLRVIRGMQVTPEMIGGQPG